jgi:hypothetical protein
VRGRIGLDTAPYRRIAEVSQVGAPSPATPAELTGERPGLSAAALTYRRHQENQSANTNAPWAYRHARRALRGVSV